MAGTTSGGGARGGIVQINVTPMVDILLVLLVILMATAQYIVRRNMQVNLPAAATLEGPAAPIAAVMIAADGSFSLDGESITDAALRTRFAEMRAESEESVVSISADRLAQHGVVVAVIDAARQARLTRFSIQVVRNEQ